MDNPSNVEGQNKNKTLTIAFICVLCVLCLVIQLSPRPPNVEFTSLFTFFTGFIFGPIVGGIFGGFVMFVNGFLSPWGFAGFNMPFQMASMALIGLVGGLYRKFSRGIHSVEFCAELAVLGAFLAVLYDFITNLGYAVFQAIMGVPFNLAILIAMAYGAPFSIIHVLSNVFVFGIAFLPMAKVANKILVVNKIG
ncbi:MAG: ECF transporter S component [Candidatus Bathyarchaeia archaeon]